ncbi:MAG: inositol monophosphatase family protein [Hyphomicrobiaceae bacterium]
MTASLITDVARILADVARTEVMPRWRNLGAGDVAEKTGPEDIVTVADGAAEAALSARLSALMPDAAVVGEEAVSADASVRERLRGAGRVWVIDPIDGTSAFAAGEPEFALMVALVEGGRPVAGWIHAPALGVTTCGGAAAGVYEGDAATGALQPLVAPALPDAMGGLVGLLGRRNISEARRAELKSKESHFRALDGVTCAGVDYARIARGVAHFALYSKSEPWDHLPGLAILSAFGFEAAKHDGSPYRPGDNSGGLLVAPDAARLAAIRKVMLG